MDLESAATIDEAINRLQIVGYNLLTVLKQTGDGWLDRLQKMGDGWVGRIEVLVPAIHVTIDSKEKL